VLCITWWFPLSERDILGVLVHKIYFWPYVYGESRYNVGWMSMCTVLCGGPPSFHCISLVLRITMLLSEVSCVVIHTANNSYTGFILPRAYDTHQWLPQQFVKLLLMMDANCVRNI